eukprot:3034735-Pleurochrysis_carterae.AAC.1
MLRPASDVHISICEHSKGNEHRSACAIQDGRNSGGGVALGKEHNASKKRSEFRRWVIVQVLEVDCFVPFDKVEELIDAGDGGDA